jgi:hypothetical protein
MNRLPGQCDEHIVKCRSNKQMEFIVTNPLKFALSATLAITGTVFMLSSEAEAKHRPPPGAPWQLSTPQTAGEPFICPMCVKKLQPGATRINPAQIGPRIPARRF